MLLAEGERVVWESRLRKVLLVYSILRRDQRACYKLILK